MKKIGLLITIILMTILVGCNSSREEPLGFKNGVVSIDMFSNDEFITYAAKYKYTDGRKYFLELSVQIPNTDGTSNKEVLKGSYFKAEENTNILTDSILIEDVEKILGEENKNNLKKLSYTTTIYNVENGKPVDGAGTVGYIFEEN